jgi:hypothetical protein
LFLYEIDDGKHVFSLGVLLFKVNDDWIT